MRQENFEQETQESIIGVPTILEEESTNTLNQEIEEPKKRWFDLSFLKNYLLLKNTLISAWKSKLQLIILLLLTAFSTAIVTGSWISYQRIQKGETFLELNKLNFDAVLPISTSDTYQIINQAFSLRYGRLYYQEPGKESSGAIYFDNSIIGQEINKVKSTDLKVNYERDASGTIIGIISFAWTNQEQPLTFNLDNENVKASLYGQLITKAEQATDLTLANYYRSAAQELYNNLFVNYSARQILDALQLFFAQWINVNNDWLNTNNKMSNNDFTDWLVNNKINYHADSVDDQDQPKLGNYNIPDSVNIATDTDVLTTKLLQEDLNNPRLAVDSFGMNGQWMTIYRDFDLTEQESPEVISDFSQNYHSKSNYNNVFDWDGTYSYYFAQAAAALQNRNINVINQFVGPAGADKITGQSVNVKVVNLGLKNNYNSINLKIFKGIYPTNKNQIVISPQYARQKRIKPGDSIVINNRTFMVSGIGSDAYNIYPIINSFDSVPNTRTEFIAYVLPDAFCIPEWFNSSSRTDIDLVYFSPWKNVKVNQFDTSYFNDYFQRTLFKNNKSTDQNQYDYRNYLINKYNNNETYQSKYQLDSNLVITKDNAQFSNYNRGKTILNTTLAGFKIGVIIGVTFLVMIVIFITYLIIKKAIQKDQVSMGILKSAGYSTGKVLTSYLAYPLLVTLLAVPIGWLIGLIFQIYFTELFNTMFSLPYNVFSFNIVPLFIAVALIGGFVLIATLISGYRLLKKQSLQLINNNLDFSISKTNFHRNSQLASKLGFKGQFLLSLTKTNWKKIAITSLVISIATLAITATISIPATISGMKNNYFKTQKYKNYYQYRVPIPNMPLSKYGLSAWTNLNNSNNETYYPVAATMPWADSIIINDKNGNKLAWYNPLDYEGNENSNNFSEIINFNDGTSESIKDSIRTQVGNYLSSLTNGPLDLSLVAWNYSWLGGRSFSNSMMKDLAKIDKSRNKNFSTSVIDFASTLLPGIIDVTNPGVPPGIEAIPEILKETLPGFIRQILDNQGTNAYDYFSIGHNTITYNPLYNKAIDGAEEELLTQLQLGSADSNLVKAGFLDVAGINPDTKMLVINSGLTQNLKYNPTATSVPMVINKSFAAKYHLSVGETINAAPNIRTLYYRNNQGVLKPLPKENWYYGSNPLNRQADDAKTLWNTNANRWNYRGQKPIGDTDYTDSYGYNYDGFYDNQGNQIKKTIPDAWNNVNQVWLKVPDDIDARAKNGMLTNRDETLPNLSFDIKNITAAPSGEGASWIRPFSFEVTDDYHGTELNPVNILTTRIPEWYGGMLEKGVFVANDSLHISSLKNEIATKFPEWWNSVVGNSTPITKYHIIGVQNSYDSPRAYIDQKWANLISGYSYYDDRSETKDPVYSNGIYQWFSGKLSVSDNIYDLIARMSFKRHADDYTIYGAAYNNQQEPMIANNDLLLKKQEMLNKMTSIAILASILFIIVTILCSILIVIMITDTFLEQFRRFMNQMKAEGYTNSEINSFTLGVFTPWVFFSYLAGYGLGYLIVFAFIKIVTNLTGLALPFAFIWWIIPISFAIIALIYFSTYIINIVQLNRMNLVLLLQTK